VKVKYFGDTDTLYIEFRETEVSETRDLDENTLIDLDREGQICAITVEHASVRADIPNFSFEQISASRMAKA
jgi:uncharacterized protein YuzE